MHGPLRFGIVAVATAVALTSATACSAGTVHPTATAQTPPVGASPPGFGGTDLAWIQVTIAMEEQLLPLLDLVPTHSTNPDIATLASRTHTTAADDLARLRTLHDRAGLPAQNPHEGMPMPGMVSAADLDRAATLDGSRFDAFALTKVEEYARQCVALAGSESAYGAEPQTVALAGRIQAHGTQILTMLPTFRPDTPATPSDDIPSGSTPAA